MQGLSVLGTVLVGVVVFAAGCGSPRPAKDSAAKNAGRSEVRAERSRPTGGQARTEIAPEKNPTSLAGRGEPSLDDPERPAAWIYVDGRPGEFAEREGHPQLEWVVEQPVSPTPTFRVETYGPLLGTPRDFKYLLKTVEAAEGSEVAYAVSAVDKTFVVGRDYPLLKPGDNFVIRNWTTGDIVSQIAPLAPGTYLIAGGVTNSANGKEAAAITYFTVGER